MLDLVLGGGWGEGRIVNVVGDSSSGKTLLAVEACANFARKAPLENIRYREAESAFDENYAAQIGWPTGLEIPEEPMETVEQFYTDLEAWLDKRDGITPCLYVLDSLDALSDAAELDMDFDEKTYGASKPKQLSKMFRLLVRKIEDKRCTLMIISQIRDKIGVVFGEKHSRSGGRALQFYCSQVLWLAEISKIKKTVLGTQKTGIERVIGTHVLAKTKKNKIGIPHRECELTIIFSYGIDDEETMLGWLNKNNGGSLLDSTISQLRATLSAARQARDYGRIDAIRDLLREACITHWATIEEALAPTIQKYR
jgi:recombination protein RecA